MGLSTVSLSEGVPLGGLRIIPPRQAQFIVIVVAKLFEMRIILPRQAHCFDFTMCSFLAGCVFHCLARRIPPTFSGGPKKNAAQMLT